MTDIKIDLNCLKSIGSELCRVFWRQLRRCHSLAGSLQLLPRIHRRVDNLHWVRAAASRLQSLFRYFRQGGVATEVRHDLLPGNYENPEREVHKWRELGKIQQSCASKFWRTLKSVFLRNIENFELRRWIRAMSWVHALYLLRLRDQLISLPWFQTYLWERYLCSFVKFPCSCAKIWVFKNSLTPSRTPLIWPGVLTRTS